MNPSRLIRIGMREFSGLFARFIQGRAERNDISPDATKEEIAKDRVDRRKARQMSKRVRKTLKLMRRLGRYR